LTHIPGQQAHGITHNIDLCGNVAHPAPFTKHTPCAKPPTTTNVVAVAAATITTTIVTATTSAAGTFPSRSAIVHDDEITKIVVNVRNQLFAV
jgi:hypothetical protein